MVEPKIFIEDVNYFYGDFQSLRNITLDVPSRSVTVFFGPAGGGKTTLLRLINRLNDMVENTRMTGRVLLDGQNIYDPDTHIAILRASRGNGVCASAASSRNNSGKRNLRAEAGGIAGPPQDGGKPGAQSHSGGFWDEIKDRLDSPAIALSGGQQQRLCIARSLALEPEVLLLDEPTSGLDPISTRKVEESLQQLKQNYTIIIVPHSIQQAARVADQAAFLLMGDLIEYRPGTEIFTTPRDRRTEDYVTGRFG